MTDYWEDRFNLAGNFFDLALRSQQICEAIQVRMVQALSTPSLSVAQNFMWAAISRPPATACKLIKPPIESPDGARAQPPGPRSVVGLLGMV